MIKKLVGQGNNNSSIYINNYISYDHVGMSWYIHVKFQDCNTIQEWNTRYQLSLTKPFTSLHGTPSVGGFPPTSRSNPPHLFLAQDRAPGDRLEITEWWFPGRFWKKANSWHHLTSSGASWCQLYISNGKNPDVQIDIDLGCIYSYPKKPR